VIHIRDEGQAIQTGFNFYPLSSNQFGFVFKVKDVALTARYNKLHGRFKFNIRRGAR
jgi:hypothetical protein